MQKVDLLSFLSIKMGLPVFFFVKLLVSYLKVPLGPPKVAEGAWRECEPPSRLNLPERLEHTFLEVVLRPKVEPVGSRSWGYCDLWRLGLGATYCSFGIKL